MRRDVERLPFLLLYGFDLPSSGRKLGSEEMTCLPFSALSPSEALSFFQLLRYSDTQIQRFEAESRIYTED